MLPALRYIPPSVHHVRLYANLYHVHPAMLADWDYSSLGENLAGCTSLRSVEITLLTEQDRLPVPVGEEKCADVQKAVHARMAGGFGKMLRFT